MKMSTSLVKSAFSSIIVWVSVARLCSCKRYLRLDDMGKLSINCMFVKIRSKIFSDRIAKFTFLLLRRKYIAWVLFSVKFSSQRSST